MVDVKAMRIGELARRVGVRPSTLRYYEDRGLLARPERVAGRREYGHATLNTFQLVRAAQRAGFTLAETHMLLSVLASRTPATRQWRDMAKRKLDEIDASLQQLRRARTALAGAIECACSGRADACTLVAGTAEGGHPGARRLRTSRRPRVDSPRS